LIVRACLWPGITEAAAALAAQFLVLKKVGWRYGELLMRGNPLCLQAT